MASFESITFVKLQLPFLSIEPLLEDLGEIDQTGIDWVIGGGESGNEPATTVHAEMCGSAHGVLISPF